MSSVNNAHIAFTVESEQGHVNPILGMMAELVRRGCRVTCPVRARFAPRVRESGGEPLIYDPWDYRVRFMPRAQELKDDPASFKALWKEYERDEFENTFAQLERLYENDKPDLVVYDFRNTAGKKLALKWKIPKVEHAPAFIEGNDRNPLGDPYDDELVIASLPREFQPHPEALDQRFHFVGPIFGRRTFFEPWNPKSREPVILISATTTLPQPAFLKACTNALAEIPHRVVLSIGDNDLESLGPLPPTFEVNRSSSQLEILKSALLFVCQGGLGSTLEALSCGVPCLVIPAIEIHNPVAARIEELKLGLRLDAAATSTQIRDAATYILQDATIAKRVRETMEMIQLADGPRLAGDLILGHLKRAAQLGVSSTTDVGLDRLTDT